MKKWDVRPARRSAQLGFDSLVLLADGHPVYEHVLSEERSDDGDFDQLNSSLKQGLKTCRSVVANYRALLLSNDNEPRDNNLDEDLELGSGGD